MGFGGIIKAKQSGVTKWIAVVLTKIQFANPGINAVTQGETIEWQTKELTATVMRDDSTKHKWQMQSTPMDTEADAEAAIKKALNITNPKPALGALTVSSAAGSVAGKTKLTVTPPVTGGNHYGYKTGATVTTACPHTGRMSPAAGPVGTARTRSPPPPGRRSAW